MSLETPPVAPLAPVPLLVATPPGWAAVALRDLDAFLLDHASCERKAAAACLSLVSKHPDKPGLVEPLVALAREELEHFLQVYRILQRRGVSLGADPVDPYIARLLRGCRHEQDVHLLDRLVAAALIEARSCERLALASEHLTEQPLKEFYDTLARSEAGHYRVFIRIAERYYPEDIVHNALQRLLPIEAEAMSTAPVRCAVH